jgi:hypothetical protein
LFASTKTTGTRDRPVGRAADCGLDARRGPDRSIIQTGSGVHPTSYQTGSVKWLGLESNNVEVKNTLIYISTPPYVFMA